ncbi:sensor histidine kinase [Pararobbsia silviterrae]|uniref:histidine kinase n=1 Tax=Pararobbsia silviterrae TaxID=1792498 RepID=A0A494Y0J1_9BURK|nr:ATP-binding protein [Pararobbsia silviterrae]RKP54829.1 HAMP domain-containing protein [Pararobbsia silviterrae]
MNLLTKGLLLIAIPSVLELGVLALLLDKQQDATRTEVWELHSRQVIDQAATLLDPLLRESSLVYGAAVTGSAKALRDPGPWSDFDRRLTSLSALVADDPLQLARLSTVGALAKQYRAWVAGYAARVGAHASSSPASMLRAANEGDAVLDRMRTSINGFSAEEDALHDSRGRTLEHLRDLQKSGLILAAIGSILITVLSAYLFTRHISLRLSALGDNAQRVADGRTLSRPMSGKDEIATLDAIVHDTSVRLNTVEREHRELSGELRERGAQLVEVNQHLIAQTSENETFVYGVSHDLRSPLVNLQGFSKELRVSSANLREQIATSSMTDAQRARVAHLVEGDFAESLHFLQNAVTRAANIVDALLRLSRVGRLDYQWRQVRVDAIVERVVNSMRQTMRERNAEIIVHPLPSVWGDETTIEQIFANLIGNALNYLDRQRPGRIEIGVQIAPIVSGGRPPSAAHARGYPGALDDPHVATSAAERETSPAEGRGAPERDSESDSGPNSALDSPRRLTHVFYVSDNGLGIPAAYLPKMFNAFQRLHGNVAKGEGIGLALVRRMVERHGGRVWLESRENVGSTFFVELPAEAPRDPSAVRRIATPDATAPDATAPDASHAPGVGDPGRAGGVGTA